MREQVKIGYDQSIGKIMACFMIGAVTLVVFTILFHMFNDALAAMCGVFILGALRT